jgi:prophage maintenance system killer protein
VKDNTGLVLFESKDGAVMLPVNIDGSGEDVWLSRNQISLLYNRDVKTIGKHITNALNEELKGTIDSVVAKFATTAKDGKTYQTSHYNIDVVLSVGYRVKSQRGIEFRHWANDVLRRYIVNGKADNEKRLKQLKEVAEIISRLPQKLESDQILDVVKSYTRALNMLDDYDHQALKKPIGKNALYALTYMECRKMIDQMAPTNKSTLFGNEKDDSFKGSIAAIFQTFDGTDVYPTLEEKAANLIYFIVKNHSFSDGNKRIAAAIFLYFLDKNFALFETSGKKRIADETLVAITIMIAESKPTEKEIMISLVMNFLV